MWLAWIKYCIYLYVCREGVRLAGERTFLMRFDPDGLVMKKTEVKQMEVGL